MFFGSVVAIVTPFTKDGEIDERALEELVKWHVNNHTDAIVCSGTTGESPTLAEREKLRILQICIEASKKEIPIIAGTGCNNTSKSIELTAKAKALGASGCLVVVPYYNKPSHVGLLKHYAEIAKVGLPVMVYHHPGRTGLTLSPALFSNLQKIDNIVSIKEASCNLSLMDEIAKNCSLPILSGDDALTVPIMQKGGTGVVSVMANILPYQWSEMTKFAKEKNFEKATEIYERYRPLNDAILMETNPQGIKYALSLLGKCNAFMRLPLVEPQEETKMAIKKEMEKVNLI